MHADAPTPRVAATRAAAALSVTGALGRGFRGAEVGGHQSRGAASAWGGDYISSVFE